MIWNDLFLFVDMVIFMSCEFGVLLIVEDFGGGCVVVIRFL